MRGRVQGGGWSGPCAAPGSLCLEPRSWGIDSLRVRAYRRDPAHPSVQHLKTLQTKRGTKLIMSGWWGTSRHINYFGDWIMG